MERTLGLVLERMVLGVRNLSELLLLAVLWGSIRAHEWILRGIHVLEVCQVIAE